MSKTTLTSAGQIHEAMLMADQSMDAVRSAVNAAVKMACMDSPDDQSWDTYVVALFPGDVVVYRDGEDTFRATYTVDLSSGDPVVTLGAPVEVEVAYVDSTEPADESAAQDLEGDLVPLIERALSDDGDMYVKAISPGWGSSGYYTAEVLSRDGPRIYPAGTHMYLDHPSVSESRDRPERSLRDLAAVTIGPAEYQEHGVDGPGLYVRAAPIASYAPILEQLAPHIGVSIRAQGYSKAGEADGRKGAVITSLERGESIDFVTRAGRGGKVLQLMESAGREPAVREDSVTEAEARALQESMTRLEEENRQQAQSLARLTEAAILREAQDLATAEVQRSVLPDLTRARVIRETVARVPLKDGAIDYEVFAGQIAEAVRQAAAEVNQALGGGAVRGMGSVVVAPAEGLAESRAHLEESFRRAGLTDSAAKLAAGTGR